MATILRSSKYVRNFAEFANRLGSSYVKSDIRREIVSQRLSAPSTLARRSLATQAAAQRLENDSNLESNLRMLDSDVKNYGRISRRKLERVMSIFQTSKSITSTQALMVIRCCGNLVTDELPETRSKLVNELWKKLEASGIPLDLSHYNALLRVYVENEYAFSPAEILAELERKGIEPNKLTYQRLISRYCQQGDIDGASKILEFMREKGISVNENIFTALVRGHSEANDMVSAADILTVMRQAGLEPSADTYKELICGYAKHGDLESVKRTFTECQTTNVHLLDTDYLSVIKALAVNGHGDHVDSIISIMPKEVGYLQDAMNHVLKLVHTGHVDVAMKVLHSIPNRESGNTGTSVMKQLVETNMPIEQLLALCKEVETKGINSRALLFGLESNLRQGNIERSLAFIGALKELGKEIREHYYWPILLAMGRSKETSGICDLLRRIQEDTGVPITGETLRDYVLPYQTNDPDQILGEFMSIGIPNGTIACAIVFNLIFRNQLKEAADFALKHNFRYNSLVFSRPLVVALAETKDALSYAKILQHVYQTRLNGMPRDSQEISSEVRIFEPYLMDLASTIRDDHFETLSKVLEELLSVGVKINDNEIANLQQAVGSNRTVERILNRLKNRSGRTFVYDPVSTQSAILRLEQALEQSRGDDESVMAKKTRLFGLYCQARDLTKLEKLITEFTDQGVELTVPMYKQSINAYLNANVLGRTDEYMKILLEKDPTYTLSSAKLIKYITLLAKEDRVDEVLQFLDDKRNIREQDADQSKIFWWRLLNGLAEIGSVRGVNEVFKLLLQNEYIDSSGPNLGPLIRVHIVRGDLNEAVREFERICETYQYTPLKNELTKKLIIAEDATALQRITDLSTQFHGESNSLYDLVASFIECDCLRQAKKILEIPALHPRVSKLQIISKRFREQGMTTYLERLVAVIKDIPHFKVIPGFYEDLLRCYANENNWEKGLDLYKQIVEEEVEPSTQFLTTLAKLLKRYNQPIPFEVPFLEQESLLEDGKSQHTRLPRRSLNRQRASSETAEAGVDGDSKISMPQKLSRAKSETELIESLVQSGKLNDAVEMTEKLLEKDMYPVHRTFRFLVMKLGTTGEIELINRIGKHLRVPMKKGVDFENNLCRAYVAAGRAEEYIDLLEENLNRVHESNTDDVMAEYPVNGIMQLLDRHPKLMEKYTKLAVSEANKGSIVPINTLWIHQFVKGNPEADKIWSEYLVKEPKVMFHRIIRNARKAESTNLMKKLIKTLNESPVIDAESKAVVYSELIKLCYLRENFQESVDVLREALSVVSLDNLCPSTLSQMKSYLDAKGLSLPADIISEIESTKERKQAAT